MSPFLPYPLHPRPPCARGLLSLLALTLSACATTTLPPHGTVVMRDVTFQLHDFRLPSGLRIVVEEDHRAPVVAVVAVVGSGGSSDPEGKEGLAHLVEHLAFRSHPVGGVSAWTRLEQMGAGRFNAFTSLDHTAYETMVPRESLPELLRLEAQRLSAPLAGVSSETLAVEREVARNELRERTETGQIGQILHWIQATSFPAGHPYVRPIVGTHDSLSSITLADAQRFAREHYRPENITVVITGDVDLETIDALLKEKLPAKWQLGNPPVAVSPRLQQPAPEPPLAPAAPELVKHQAAVATPELYLTWVLPRGFDEASVVHQFVRASLVYRFFDTMMSDEDFDEDIADIDTELISGTRASLLVVRVSLKKGEHPDRTATRVLKQVHQLWENQSSREDARDGYRRFLEMRRTVFVGLALEAENLLDRARTRAELTHFSMDVTAYARTRDALVALNRPQITGFARQWLQRDRARSFLVLPGENPAPVLASLPGQPLREEDAAPGPRGPRGVELALSVPISSLRLPNGLQVVMAPRPGLPVVSVGVALGGGEASSQRPGIAEYAERVSFPKTYYQGLPGDYGLHSSSRLYPDHLRYKLAGASGNVGNMLAMLGEHLSSMGTNYIVLNYYEKYVLPGRKATDSLPEVQASRAFSQALYGKHPYGHPATGEDLAKVTRSALQDWLDQVHTPANALVVIAGEFDPQQVLPLVKQYLGGWSDKGTPVEVPAVPPPPKPGAQTRLLITPRPDAQQTQVQVACRLPETTPEAEARYALMSSVMQARLWRQMRERMGATYGFQVGTWMARGGAAHLQIEGMVARQHLETSLSTIRAALTDYAQRGVPEAELEAARGRLLAEHTVRLTTSDAWVNALLDTGVMGWQPEALTRRPVFLQAVASEALRQEFSGCLERMVVGIVGDEAQARSALQATLQP
jgi:zinc protease